MSAIKLPIEKILKNEERKKKTATNSVIVQKTKRPQVYVKRDKIATGQDKARKKGHVKMLDHWAVELYKRGYEDSLKGLAMPAGGEPVLAKIDTGRWVAICLDPECSGAEVVDPSNPVFMCLSCGNINNRIQGIARLRPVSFPGNIKGIEEPLKQRPRINRNWTPNESINDLWEENIDNYQQLYKGSKIPLVVAKELGYEPKDVENGLVSTE